ncbi:MAG: hypothetical protein LZF86_10123 [Nitrospira sp.]|nr:MAG: hypothetical protein LZF86_10123 [Nitrospira sp.]
MLQKFSLLQKPARRGFGAVCLHGGDQPIDSGSGKAGEERKAPNAYDPTGPQHALARPIVRHCFLASSVRLTPQALGTH